MFSLIYAWINDWVNNREAGDLRRQHGHYDVIVMEIFTELGFIGSNAHPKIVHAYSPVKIYISRIWRLILNGDLSLAIMLQDRCGSIRVTNVFKISQYLTRYAIYLSDSLDHGYS